MRAIGIAAAALFLAGAAAAQPVRVVIPQGALVGAAANGVAVFKAIPYAAPPVGALRWRPPAPPAPWTGVRDATAFGAECMQPQRPDRPQTPMSEDCLTLNIWTPAERKAGALAPVMVWIHGGAFVWGTGGTPYYDGANFARRGVVVVTLNYRLGRFGFFAHPALTAEAAGGPTADWGFMDQIAALKWVKANIAAFGGDPHRVTIAGESAGAMSVNYLMTAPAARGLFQGAISESGFGRTAGQPLRGGPQSAEAVGAAFAGSVGVSGEGPAAAAALRALPAEALNHPPTGLLDPAIPRPIVDGVLIPDTVPASFAAHAEAKVPYLVGGNSWEASLLPALTKDPQATLAMLGPAGPRAETLFGGAGDAKRTVADLTTDATVIEPDRYLSERLTADGARAYDYFFDYLPLAERAAMPGVPHGGEIGFVFGTLPDHPVSFGPLHIAAATPEDRKVSAAVNAYWAAFVTNADPGGAGGPAWPRFTTADQTVMVFGPGGPAPRAHFQERRLDFVAQRAALAGGAVKARPLPKERP